MHNRLVLEDMKRIFGHTRTDWMGFKVTKHNKLTYHHINEKRNGGEESVSNGALLTRKAHTYLHMLETLNPELYEEYNYYFRIINDMRRKPTSEIMEIMYYKQKELIDIIYSNNIDSINKALKLKK